MPRIANKDGKWVNLLRGARAGLVLFVQHESDSLDANLRYRAAELGGEIAVERCLVVYPRKVSAERALRIEIIKPLTG